MVLAAGEISVKIGRLFAESQARLFMFINSFNSVQLQSVVSSFCSIRDNEKSVNLGSPYVDAINSLVIQ
jgi:hypothetical protein